MIHHSNKNTISITPWQCQCLALSQWSAIGIALFIPFSTSLTDILFVLGVGLYLLAQPLSQWNKLIDKGNTMQCTLLAAFIVILLSTLYSTATLHAILHSIQKYQKLLLGALLFPVFRDTLTQKSALLTLLASIIVFLCITILAYFHILPIPVYRHDPTQQAAFFKNHIESNFLMALCSYFMAYLSIHNRAYRRVLFGTLFLLSTWSVLCLSSGRSGYVIFIALMLLLAWQQWHTSLRAIGKLFCMITLLSSTLVMVYQHAPHFKQRIDQTINTTKAYLYHHHTHSSMGERLTYAKTSLQLIAQRPLIGFGTGSFAQAYQSLTGQKNHNPHNEYLKIGVQCGILGMLLFISMFVYQWKASLRYSFPYQSLVQAIILAIALGCLGNSWLTDSTEGHLYVYLLALLGARVFPLTRSEGS